MMKHLVLFSLLFFLSYSAQSQNAIIRDVFPVKDGSIMYMDTVTLEGYNAGQVYEAAKTWTSNVFTPTRGILLTDDPFENRLLIRGQIEPPQNDKLVKDGLFFFKMNITCFDGFLVYQITDFTYTVRTRHYDARSISELEHLARPSDHPKEKKRIKRDGRSKDICLHVHRQASAIAGDLRRKIPHLFSDN